MRNGNELEAAAEERLFDAMLAEVARDAVPVRARAGAPRWLAAAVVLLGLAVVAGVVFTSRGTLAPAAAPQDPAPLPSLVEVRGIAALRQADRRVENLACAIEGPDFGVLQEFVALRALRVEQDYNLPHPTLVQSAWSLAPLAQCTRLESLCVGPLARFTAVELAPIAALPNLRSLELVGTEKDIDADFAAVLGKLPLRSLVLDAVHLLPEGLRAVGELPLLERLELRDCTGLETCDLKHLYRLRQLRALTLRGVGRERQVGGPMKPGDPITIQPPEVPHRRPVLAVTGEWMRGLANALPDLRELDLAGSRIDGETLAALPRTLTFLGVNDVLCRGNLWIPAIGELPELRAFACGDPLPKVPHDDDLPFATWLPLLQQKKLCRFEFAGVPTKELVGALRDQAALRELRLDASPWTRFSFQIRPGKEGMLELPMPDFASLGELPDLRRIELIRPSVGLEQGVRRSVGDRVRIDVLPH